MLPPATRLNILRHVIVIMKFIVQNKQTAFHLAARNGHLNCLQLLYVAVQCSQSLDDVPKTDKVESDHLLLVFHGICRTDGTWHVMPVHIIK